MQYKRKSRPGFGLLTAVICVGLAAFSGALFAQIESQSGDDLQAEGVLPDMAFYAGGNLNISAKSQDDIFAAGGDVSLTDIQADHVIAAGGDVVFSDIAVSDVVAAGGNIDLISGTITDDIVAAGGDVSLRSGLGLAGSAVLSGGDVTVETPVGGELRVAAGRLSLNADVAGDAYLSGDRVVIGPNVRIGGDLRHRAGELTIDPSAEIRGQVVELEALDGPDFERWSIKAGAAIAVFAIAFLIGAGILVIVIAMVLPGLMNSAAAMIGEKPLSTVGIGILVVVVGPAVMAALFATVFGAPLALMILAIYAATAPLALAATIYFAGQQGRRLVGGQGAAPPGLGARAIWSAIATGVFIVVALIPILGGVLWILAYLFGLGAVLTRGGKALAAANTP